VAGRNSGGPGSGAGTKMACRHQIRLSAIASGARKAEKMWHADMWATSYACVSAFS
jgi:hypothetical protein